ncbi:MAG: hypothetical protein E3J72_15510 [Planctomycetota bacterium]|nr:MAG: hypothetical protein E3J72_15510 [Planctomycetota bacterium]
MATQGVATPWANALGYTELVIISIWAIHAMAGAQKAGISVSKLDSACGWVEQCTSPYNGGVYYSLEATKTNVHRTGGSMSAFLYAGKSGSSKYSGFASYFKERFAEIPEGHSSAAMGYLNGALGSAAIGQDQWDKFVSNFFENIISHQNGDGSFQAFDGEGKYGPGEFDGAAGPTYRTGLYVLILNLDMGNLYTLGGS